MIVDEVPDQLDSHPYGLRNQISLFANLVLPNMLGNLLVQCWWLISSSFAGKMKGPDVLAAISVTMLGSLLARFIMFGILSGFDTLAGNAMGAKNYSEVGYLFQSTVVLLGVLCIPATILFSNAYALFSLLDQPEEVVSIASQYLKFYILILPMECLAESIKSFYRAQNITIPFLLITVIATIGHYFYVHTFQHVMLAFVLTEGTILVLCLLYFRQKTYNEFTWKGIDIPEAVRFTRLKNLMRLGLPGIFAMSDWFFYEFQTIIVGHLGKAALAAHSVAYFILPVPFFLAFAVATAAQTRIATVIGEQNMALAKKLCIVTLVINATIGVLSAVVTYSLGSRIFSHFIKPSQIEVIKVLNQIWPIISMYMILDCFLASAQGIFRGLSEHLALAKIMFVTLWVIGVPLELIAVYFVSKNLVTVWIGVVLCFALMIGSCLVYLQRYWERHHYSLAAAGNTKEESTPFL